MDPSRKRAAEDALERARDLRREAAQKVPSGPMTDHRALVAAEARIRSLEHQVAELMTALEQLLRGL
jgi:uncharacterized membrane protein